MAARPYNLGDAPTRPSLWLDAMAAGQVFVDANNRVQAVAGKGTTNESYTPLTSARAALYTSTAFTGTMPGFKFTATRSDLLRTTTSAPPQPSTIVMVWQTGPTRKNYEVVLSTDNANTDPKLNVFGSFGNGKILISPPGASGGGIAASVGLNGVNVLIIQNNGAASRYWYNGAVTTFDQGTAVISRNGVDLGGLFNDTATPFDGVLAEIAFIPAVFAGDDWDRITQGTAWRWGQQAQIPADATYKSAAPMVEIPAAAAGDGSQYQTLTSPTTSFRTPAAVDPLAHSHAATSPTLTAGTTMAVQDLTHSHAATSPTVSSKQTIAANSLQHAHTETPTSLLYQTTVAALSSIQAQAMTAAALGAGGSLSVDSASQAHALAAAALTAKRALVSPNSLTHAQALAAAAFTHVSPPDTIEVDPLDFGVDLASIRDRVILLKYFLSVTDVLDASEALDETLPASPPAAFVGVASERAEPNKTIGGHSQRVRVEIAILFAESTSRFDRDARDRLDLTRRALIRQLVAWTPKNAGEGLEYSRYRVVKIGDGLAWGEVTFTTSYRLTI